MTLTVDQAAQKIHGLVHDEGFLGTDRNDHMHEVENLLKQFSPHDADQVVAKLSDDDLHALADNANSGGIFGAQGLSTGEKRDFFNDLAKELDGQQLGRLAHAFSDRGDVQMLGDAVAGFAPSQTKVDFVKAIAGDATSGDTKLDTGFGYSTLNTGDKEALAINKVLASMKGDATGFNAAVNALSDDQLAAVVKAGEGEKVTTTAGFMGDASVQTSHDPAGLRSMLDAAATSNDAKVKARVFEAGTRAIDDIRGSDTLLTPNPGAGDSAKVVADGLSNVMNSDTRGIVNALNKDDWRGKALTGYLQEVIRENPSATNPAIGNQIAALQGAGTGMTASQFYNQAEPSANGDHFYRNAENLGYYAGAVQAAISKMNASDKTKGDILSNVFGTVVSAGSAAVPGLSVGGKVGVQLFNGLTKEAVREVVADVTAHRKDLAEALTELALPRDPGQTERTQSSADPYYDARFAVVSQNNQ